MSLKQLIEDVFPEGLSYEDSAALCMRLYCSLESIPESLHSECDREGISETFAQLYRNGNIYGPTDSSVLSGANFHSCYDKGHWIEILASIFKKGMSYDEIRAKELIQRIQQSNVKGSV